MSIIKIAFRNGGYFFGGSVLPLWRCLREPQATKAKWAVTTRWFHETFMILSSSASGNGVGSDSVVEALETTAVLFPKPPEGNSFNISVCQRQFRQFIFL